MIFMVFTDKLGKKFMVNVSHVETFIPLRVGGGVIIRFTSGREIEVTEDITYIEDKLQEAIIYHVP